MLIFTVVGSCVAVFTYRRRKRAAQRGRALMENLARAGLGEGPWEAEVRMRDADGRGGERQGWASVQWLGGESCRLSLIRAADDGPVLATRHAEAGADFHWAARGSGPVTWFAGLDGPEPGIFSDLLSYEDLTAAIRCGAVHRLVPAKGEEAARYHVLDRIPAKKNRRYKRARLWVDRERSRVERMEFFDRKNRCVLRKRVTEWEALPGGAHLPRRLAVEDPRDGRLVEAVFEGFRRLPPASDMAYEGLVPLSRGAHAGQYRPAAPAAAPA